MFEKDAEEWAKENIDIVKTVSYLNHDCNYYSEEERSLAKSAFKNGAELGYNKANEYAKIIIQELLNNSDEYARQRAMDFLKEE